MTAGYDLPALPLAVRGRYSRFDYGIDRRVSGNEYEGDIELESFGVLLDWFPTGRGFRVTGGVLWNGNAVAASSDSSNLGIGGTRYSGTLSVEVELGDQVAPYLGLGWRGGQPKGVGFSRELGSRLSRIEKRLGGSLPEPKEASNICGGRVMLKKAQLTFENNSSDVHYDDNGEDIKKFVEVLDESGGGVVLTVGYATAIGEDTYNVRLSDERAACASLCIRERLADPLKFTFREIARGETMVPDDLPGTKPDSRRVEVILCQSGDDEGAEYAGASSDLLPDSSACGCPPMSATTGSSEEED